MGGEECGWRRNVSPVVQRKGIMTVNGIVVSSDLQQVKIGSTDCNKGNDNMALNRAKDGSVES